VTGTSDGKRLWSVGRYGTILESGDGEHWNALISGTPNHLLSIFGTTDGKRLWVVGVDGTILRSNDGEHWRAVSSGTQNHLVSIFGTSDGKRLWAVGYNGTILESGDGEHWRALSSGTQNHLSSIFGTSDGKRLWAVGGNGTILESFDGEHWRALSSGTQNHLSSIFGTSDGKRLWAVGGNGTILESFDGEHWKASTSGTTSYLFSIFGTSDGGQLWAVGGKGTILESSDGEHWKARTSGTQVSVFSVFGTSDGRRLWVVGDNGTILESREGEHWTVRATGAPNTLGSVIGTGDGKRLWAVGGNGTILESGDGEHWRALSSGTQNHLSSIFGTSDGKRLWAVGGNGTILESGDGEHWKTCNSATPYDLFCIFGSRDGKRLWAGGANGTILRSNDGEHWNALTSGTTNYLLSLFGTGDGKRLWAVGGKGTILESSDGEHWNARYSGTQTPLISIFGTDDVMRLWTVSTDGTIRESSDGEHWCPRPAWVPHPLRSIFATRDGRRLWAVGDSGSIVAATALSVAPFITDAQLGYSANGEFLELHVSGQMQDVQVQATALNDYEFSGAGRRGWPSLAPCSSGGQTGQWRCSLDNSTLHPEVTSGPAALPMIHFYIAVYRDGGEDIYEFAAHYEPRSIIAEHPGIASVVGFIVIMTVIPTILLFFRPLWNLRLYRALKLNQIETIDIPGLGGVVHLIMRLVTVLPWFIRNQRTLDAWVLENQRILSESWANEGEARGQELFSNNGDPHPREVYIPLPIRIGDPRSGAQILQPCANDIRTLIAAPRTMIQIIGPGGAGKTTLARQIGKWAFENQLEAGIATHPMLPIWVDEELDHLAGTRLRDVVKGKLSATFPSEGMDDVLFSALLEKQRLLIFVDRLSERSATTQRHIETIFRETQIGLLVVTSRTTHRIDGCRTMKIFPQPLNSATLLRFMTELLSVFLDASEEVKPFSTIRGQCDLGVRLATLIRLHTKQDDQDVPLIPLPVRLFVEQAVRIVREGKPLDDLPASLPEVYLRQLRLINPQDVNLTHFVEDDRMLKVAKALATTSLGSDFVPKEFTRSQALATLQAIGESVAVNCDPIRRLVLNGVLIEKAGGMNVRLRFALDPVAEFLAAVSYGEGCAFDDEKWTILMLESEDAPGFQVATKLVRQSYWSTSR
jgi:photosystem II stability/assembly factor-like uncharacterized protein